MRLQSARISINTSYYVRFLNLIIQNLALTFCDRLCPYRNGNAKKGQRIRKLVSLSLPCLFVDVWSRAVAILGYSKQLAYIGSEV